MIEEGALNGVSIRSEWVSAVEAVMRTPLKTLSEGTGDRLRGLPHHSEADEGRLATIVLELAGRVLNSIAPWLACEGGPEAEHRIRESFAGYAQEAIRCGCDPDHQGKWHFEKHQQALVDAAFLATALLRAPRVLWEPLDRTTKERLVDRFRGLRNRKPHFNNWLLFGAATEAFLASVGEDWDRMRVDFALRQHEQWYVGDSHYKDGMQFHDDYYNSFVIHPMMHEVMRTVAPFDGHWQELLERHERRLARYAVIQERSITTDGSWPVKGRSICYRTGAFHALAYAAWQGLLPDALPPPQVRSALTAAIRKGLMPAANFREDGWLEIGLSGAQPALGEAYITTASLYLAGFVFAPLGLPPEEPFWGGPEMPWTHLKTWEMGVNLPADHAMREGPR